MTPEAERRAPRILLVDDDAMNRKYFYQVLEKEHYEIDEAASGEEATAKIEGNNYDVILSDLHMYKVGGLDVLQRAKSKDPLTQVLIMTGYGSISTAVAAMQNGAFDYISKPVRKEALLLRVQRALRERELQLRLKEQQERIDAHNRLIERDLELAQRVQASLVPPDFENDRYAVAIHYEPMIGIGGDFCNIHHYSEDRFAANMVDVTGHGISAALLVNRLCNEMEAILRSEPNPGRVLAQVNDFFYTTFSKMGLFMTIFSLHVDLKNLALTYAGGAHPSALLMDRNGSLVELPSQNLIIGFMPSAAQTFSESSRPLNRGDRLVVYTDGILEAEDRGRRSFGLEQLKGSVLRHRGEATAEACRRIVDDVKSWSGGELHDDVMLLMIDIK